MNKKPLLKFAHISDLHFGKGNFGFSQFLSKRWLGNLNYLLFRRKHFLHDRIQKLTPLFNELNIENIIVSGDVSTTSLYKEFALAKDFTQILKEASKSVYVIPGNHDTYTRKTQKKNVFYQYFSPSFEKNSSKISSFNLKDHFVCAKKLEHGFWLIGMDTTIATNLYYSTGNFTQKIEENLKQLLDLIPKNEKVIVVNHFPFFFQDDKRRRLERGKSLENLLKNYPNVFLYVHGHTHKRSLVDLRHTNLPIILDSGSCSHKTQGSWNLIEIYDDHLEVSLFTWNIATDNWVLKEKEELPL